MLAIQKARNSSGWVKHIAAKYGKPVAEMRRLLRTSQALVAEVAILYNDMAREEAKRLVADDTKPPQGDDLLSELTRRYHYALFSDKKKQAKEAASRAFAAEAKADREARKGAT
jgi:hypothetical protein